ncbi:MAG: hypothetical protein ACKVZ6_20215, partial [Kineosporiaceae bacterium]
MWDRLQMRHPGLAMWRVGMCEALVALGDRTTAWRFAEEHRALAEQVGSPGPRAAALRAPWRPPRRPAGSRAARAGRRAGPGHPDAAARPAGPAGAR